MASGRGFALLGTPDQWLRASHHATTIDPIVGSVELSWDEPESSQVRPPTAAATPAGLAFDASCRLYHSLPDQGRVERVRWRAHDPLAAPERARPGVEVIGTIGVPSFGDFRSEQAPPGALLRPTALAVDVDDRLFVAESDARRILVYDLWSRRLLRRVELGARPVDVALADDRRTVWVLAHEPVGLLRLTARTEPVIEAPRLSSLYAVPVRMTASPEGNLCLLCSDADGFGVVVYRDAEHAAWRVVERLGSPFLIGDASDLEFVDAATLVIARASGQPFARLVREGSAWTLSTPLLARGYDGAGIVRTPDARIGFWTRNGFREAVSGRVRYAPSGRVSTFRLDAGEHQTRWGRVFLDACIPPGTSVRLACVSTDEGENDAATIAWQPPAKRLDAVRPPGSPPLVPITLAPVGDVLPQTLHLRETGRELAWSRPAPGDPFETYEAPIEAAPGRYLWITLELLGTTRTTPRIRCLRAEHPTHDYLSRLPRTYTHDPEATAFLERYLAMFEGTLGDIDGRSAERLALLDPWAAPAEILGWLAGFLGLALDERWSESARRQLIAEAACLFRFRGTVRGLERFIEIVLGCPRVMLLEHWRFRGLGGAFVGGQPAESATSAVVGNSFRVGGSVAGSLPASGSAAGERAEDAFRTHAHRFSLVIPATLRSTELDVVRHVLDVHRPAHTVYDICTVGSGMRVGRGLHLGLLSLVGRTGGFTAAQLGALHIGQGAVIGRPELGTRPGSSRLATTARVG